MQNRNSVKVCLKHKIEFTIANYTCASRISPPSSVASRRGVFAIHRTMTEQGVTKVKMFQVYKLHFDGVLSGTPNAMSQRHALHGADIAFLIAKYPLVGA